MEIDTEDYLGTISKSKISAFNKVMLRPPSADALGRSG
jgi:hypothetical protein